MSKPDLSMTEGVKLWAESVTCYSTGYVTPNEHECWDTETAAYLAECVRLRQAFDGIGAPEELGSADLVREMHDAIKPKS